MYLEPPGRALGFDNSEFFVWSTAVKAAIDINRLLNEGSELIGSRVITLPRPEKDLLIRVRTGKYGSFDRVLGLANTLFADLDESRRTSSLAEEVDKSAVSKLVSSTYLELWKQP